MCGVLVYVDVEARPGLAGQRSMPAKDGNFAWQARRWPMKVRDAIKRKAGRPEVIDASRTVAEVIRHMRDRRVRRLIVTDNGRLVGLVDSVTVLSRLGEVGGAALDEKVAEFVTKEAVTVGPDVLLSDANELFQEHRVNHLVVIDGGTVAGLLTPVDVLRRLLDHSEFLNEHMRDYVSGTGYLEPDDEFKLGSQAKLAVDSAAL